MKDNIGQSRFELENSGLIAFAHYQRNKNILVIDHVFVPPELRNSGLASKLMLEIAQKAQAENLKISPVCSYAEAWMRRHQEYQELLA